MTAQGVWPNNLLENERFQGSVLHVAAMHGHVEACELLVRLGADVHLRQKQGLTPLHVAAQFGAAPPSMPQCARKNLLLAVARRLGHSQARGRVPGFEGPCPRAGRALLSAHHCTARR